MHDFAVFLDRDGTIIEEVVHLSHPDQVRILPGAAQAVASLNRLGAKVILVTNQSAVARGCLSIEELDRIHRELKRKLLIEGAWLDTIYYCPHHPEIGSHPYRKDCNCRKPNPGLLEKAANDLHLDLRQAFMVGDKVSDLEAGYRAGCQTILVLTGHGKEALETLPGLYFQPEFVVSDLLEASEKIIQIIGGNLETGHPEL